MFQPLGDAHLGRGEFLLGEGSGGWLLGGVEIIFDLWFGAGGTNGHFQAAIDLENNHRFLGNQLSLGIPEILDGIVENREHLGTFDLCRRIPRVGIHKLFDLRGTLGPLEVERLSALKLKPILGRDPIQQGDNRDSKTRGIGGHFGKTDDCGITILVAHEVAGVVAITLLSAEDKEE